MYFHRRKAILYTTIGVLVILLLFQLISGFDLFVTIFFSIILMCAIVYQFGYYWFIDGHNLKKYVFFKEVSNIRIDHIKLVEAISIKEFGSVQINLGKGPFEDEYVLVMKNGSTIKTSSKS